MVSLVSPSWLAEWKSVWSRGERSAFHPAIRCGPGHTTAFGLRELSGWNGLAVHGPRFARFLAGYTLGFRLLSPNLVIVVVLPLSLGLSLLSALLHLAWSPFLLAVPGRISWKELRLTSEVNGRFDFHLSWIRLTKSAGRKLLMTCWRRRRRWWQAKWTAAEGEWESFYVAAKKLASREQSAILWRKAPLFV